MRPRPSLARSSALNFVDGAVSLIAALGVSILLARALHPDGFGLYALVMSIVSFVYLFARLGIPGTVRRYVAELDGKGERALIPVVAGRGVRATMASAVIAALVLAAASGPLSEFFGQPKLRGYFLLGAVLLLPMLGISVFRGLLGGLQQYRFLMQVNLFTSPVWVAACGFAVWRGGGIGGVLVATLGVELINLAAYGLWSERIMGIKLGAALPAALRQRLNRYNLALAALILLNAIVWQRSEILFLGRLSGADQVSFYAVPFAITERVVDLIPGAILGVLLPGLTYAQASADLTRLSVVFGEALRYLALLTLPIAIIGIPLAPIVIRLLYGPGFGPAAIVLQILLVSVIFGVLGQASRSALLGMESQGLLLKTGALAAVLSITLDIVLIPRWGAIGAAIANTTVQGVWAAAIFTPLWRRFGQRPPIFVRKAVSSS